MQVERMCCQHPLQTYLKRQSLRREDFAQRCGTTLPTLSRIIKRKQKPSLDLIERMVEATNWELTANDFLSIKPPEGVPVRDERNVA
ncbi:helix-turn-helix transcriptional regulator [Pseudovibrio exalbescens]|uniref:helix-turn-helix domain-containing protein n=1 Tax=Pseudovibrio exalbescens TaxID=197461 RepID=UPI00236615FC|nr:helix-turn-helix transcriptional regulator [Pseudovibrio exalbescens]MDD7908658.1 helix-turn-helix transcriptional regulator [Pseudovibrio exalbescens]